MIKVVLDFLFLLVVFLVVRVGVLMRTFYCIIILLYNSRYIYLYYGWKRKKNFNWLWTAKDLAIPASFRGQTYIGTY